jgi:HMG-box domain
MSSVYPIWTRLNIKPHPHTNDITLAYFPRQPHSSTMSSKRVEPLTSVPNTSTIGMAYSRDHNDITYQLQQMLHGIRSLANLSEVTAEREHVANTHHQVIVALATLQSSVQDLSRAYINHANTVLAPGRGGALDSNLTNILSESGLLTGPAAGGSAPATATVEPEVEGKKKRKRTPHDPNAPKRALTPYFLYMQSARAQIAKELGDSAKPKEVADEGTRRWTQMPQTEKTVSVAVHESYTG